MAEIIDLKQAVLEIGPENPAMRYHALEVYNYIEQCENFVVNPKERVYNGIEYGDWAVLNGKKKI